MNTESNLHRKSRLALFSILLILAYLLISPTNAFSQTSSSRGLLGRLAEKQALNFKASFSYGPGYPVARQPVQFLDTSSRNATSWQWDFGDGSTSTEQNPTHAYMKSGFRKVTLIVARGTISKKSVKTITIMPSPAQASFVFSPGNPKIGQTVQFADTSSGDPTAWQWDFGDGTTSTVKNPSHAYSGASSYTVILISSNSSGSRRGSDTVTVTAIASPIASFATSPNSPLAGETVQFTDTSVGTPTSWQWSFGDGSTSTSQNPSHAYMTSGSKTVTLTATNASGSNSSSRTVTVASALAASFSYSPGSSAAGQSVQFTDTSVGIPTSWQWSFGDGTISTAQNPSHAYTTTGPKTVTLTAINSSGSNSSSRTVTVVTALAASFTYSPASPAAGQSVQFTDTSVGSPTFWQWSFNDGGTSAAQNPSHIFTSSGSYNVVLTNGTSSGSSSISCVLTIMPASTLTANFSYSPSSPVLGQAIQFTETSTGSPTSWLWNFGDGITSDSQNPSYTYSAAGSYTVTLTISSGADSSSASKTVSVEYSDVITAASASLADVSAAVTAARAGDTVIVPAGSATWSGYLNITKGISIVGAGIGNTIITAGSTHIFRFSPDALTRSNQDLFRISGFTFRGSPNYVILLEESNSETVPIRNLRIDHNRWENSSGYPIYIDGNFWGVIDSNQFAGANFFMILGNQQTGWNTFNPVSYGTADNLYFEDNTFSGSFVTGIQSGQGGRWAFRHNTLRSRWLDSPMFDQHGNQPNGIYSLMLCEIYENEWTGTTQYSRWDYQRGGMLLMYNNSGAGSMGTPTITVNDDVDSTEWIQWPHGDYFFNNVWNGTRVNATEGVDIGNRIEENREFWNQANNFNGTAGIGVGLLANRPTTCMAGVAYWATDTKTLYKATAPNNWTPYYSPYTYPHPLRK